MMERDEVSLPPLDASFVAWLQAHPTFSQLLQQAVATVQMSVRSGTVSELMRGRDAAQFIRSIADEAGCAQVAVFYYPVYECFCLRLIALSCVLVVRGSANRASESGEKEVGLMAKRIARRQREWSEGHQRVVRLVQQWSTSCDTCSARLPRTHDYVFYGTVCLGCWSVEQTDGVGPNGKPLVCHEGEKESVYAQCVGRG